MKSGDRVFIADASHPWSGHAGELLVYERYGLGWMGWRVKLDGYCNETYANESQLTQPKTQTGKRGNRNG